MDSIPQYPFCYHKQINMRCFCISAILPVSITICCGCFQMSSLSIVVVVVAVIFHSVRSTVWNFIPKQTIIFTVPTCHTSLRDVLACVYSTILPGSISIRSPVTHFIYRFSVNIIAEHYFIVVWITIFFPSFAVFMLFLSRVFEFGIWFCDWFVSTGAHTHTLAFITCNKNPSEREKYKEHKKSPHQWSVSVCMAFLQW